MSVEKVLKQKYPRYAERLIAVWHNATGERLNEKAFTKINFSLFVDALKTEVSNSSARTYLAMFKATLNMVNDTVNLPSGYERILTVKDERPMMCYLNESDLQKVERYEPKNENERIVKAQFLIECYTGARTSDVERFDVSNLQDGFISYVSQKTKIMACVPCKPIVEQLIRSGENKGSEMALKTKEDIIRRILRNAGVNDIVKVFKAGKEMTGEKWRFCSSHTGRRSFASNMYLKGVDLFTISKLMGHSDVGVTQRYVVCGIRQLPSEALEYFK
jgi:site-specific recombinase XerD